MRSPLKILPSLATGNLLKLGEEIKRLELAGADGIHLDCMDGHFVPLLTIGVPVLEQIRQATALHLDVHIMVTNPDAVFCDYLSAGADTLTFQAEAALHAHRICTKIKEQGKRSGVALNPSTHWHQIEYLLPYLDQVTIMGVNPGYSRQKHIPTTAIKIKELSLFCKDKGYNIEIQIDGGVTVDNVKTLFLAGAQNAVAGGSIFSTEDYSKAIANLKNASAAVKV